jgi:hypothetical protein
MVIFMSFEEDSSANPSEYLLMSREGIKFLGKAGIERAKKVGEFLKAGPKAPLDLAPLVREKDESLQR